MFRMGVFKLHRSHQLVLVLLVIVAMSGDETAGLERPGLSRVERPGPYQSMF